MAKLKEFAKPNSNVPKPATIKKKLIVFRMPSRSAIMPEGN